MAHKFPRVKFEANPASFENPTLSFLYQYWKDKRGERKMPSRKDILPSEIKDHLGWVVMLDVLPGMEEFRYRLVGTRVNQYFNIDSTGLTVSQAWAPQGKDAIDGVLAILRAVARDKLILRCYGHDDWSDLGLEKFDSIYLPLSDDGESVNVILHAFVFDTHEVAIARQIAKANGGQLLQTPR
ncbi:MAG: PAS domain-containing protein [Proteobacteria bacterium]|nr:PAS domain-containing protein [Pseudomonadota bacterium]